MKMSATGRAALASREGNRLKAYKDSVGVWTIGVGVTHIDGKPIQPGMTITAEESDALFAKTLAAYEATVAKTIKKPMAQHEFDAFASICYNIGQAGFANSTFARRFNEGDRPGCASAIMSWKKPPEIVTRREAERDQFLTPYEVALPKARSTDRARVGAPVSTPKEARVWAEQKLTKAEVKGIQLRLQALGYAIVGYADGIWGTRTVTAVKALQERAGIKADGRWGPQTEKALDDDANKAVVSVTRAETTADTLREAGAPVVVKADKIDWAQWGTIGVSLIAIIAEVLGNIPAAQAEMPWWLSTPMAFAPGWVAPIAATVFAIYTRAKAKGIIGVRVAEERTGVHNGELEAINTGTETPDRLTEFFRGIFGKS